MLKVKKGVQPPIVYLMAAVANVAEKYGLPLVITSGLDGKHSDWSGHYQLRALDIRVHNIGPNDREPICELLRHEAKRLMGVSLTQIYCKIHSPGTSNAHIHLQFK